MTMDAKQQEKSRRLCMVAFKTPHVFVGHKHESDSSKKWGLTMKPQGPPTITHFLR